MDNNYSYPNNMKVFNSDLFDSKMNDIEVLKLEVTKAGPCKQFDKYN